MKSLHYTGILAAALAIGVYAQEPSQGLSLRFVSPEPDTYLSGTAVLKVAVEPAVRALEVTARRPDVVVTSRRQYSLKTPGAPPPPPKKPQ
mgnify:CR=1 FL=1